MKDLFHLQGKFLLTCLVFLISVFVVSAQNEIPLNPQLENGNQIQEVEIILSRQSETRGVNQKELDAFYQSFPIRPGENFSSTLMDLAIKRITEEENVAKAYYKLYRASQKTAVTDNSVLVLVYVEMTEEEIVLKSDKGLLTSAKDFPLLYESKSSQFKLLLNGILGIYNDENAFFGQGEALTQGNPIADNPSAKENRFWLETSLETGLSAISKIPNSSIYLFGEISALVSARNISDIYSSASDAFLDFERLYAGFLIPELGKNKGISLLASYGRNFYQLNDGFLISRYSGSANAGHRAGVYTSPRTTFQKNAQLKLNWKNWSIVGTFLEPEELYKDKQLNTNYFVGSLDYRNKQSFDLGISYIQVLGGKAVYNTASGTLVKKGMYIINPKLWIHSIAGTSFFFKTEFAQQLHLDEDMKAYAWYMGAGYRFEDLRARPSLYYRYAFMQGDKPETYERFDPMLTGGLGNWVQGLNFRKVVGNGNITSHRLEASAWINSNLILSLDYHYLRADQLNNIGAVSAISQLKDKNLGQEFTLSLKGPIIDHLTLLTTVSYAIPGKALKANFDENLSDWFTAQVSLFINF